MLNIFYNRDAEIKMLEGMAAEEEQLIEQNDENSYEAWLKEKIAAFRIFLHDQELSRRCKEETLEQRPYHESSLIFIALMAEL
ncbi:MAG: hypothetical protein U9N61_03600 [Euryarchaeota archaeon]|nr:hypothetical protein [Euryarchaeota archaeon]